MSMVSGFSFFHNVSEMGYPFVESILSVLPLVDEFIAVVVKGDDDTRERIREIGEKKIKIVDVENYDNLSGDTYFKFYTDLALSLCRGFWRIYIQADEVLVPQGYDTIASAMKAYESRDEVMGLVLRYRHFYASPRYYHDTAPWYRWEVRVIKNVPGISAWRDAQGFRIKGRKIPSAVLSAYVHHYGWMLPLEQMRKKIARAVRIREDRNAEVFEVFTHTEGLKKFNGEHPPVMRSFIERNTWPELRVKPLPLRRRFQKLVADVTERFFRRRFLEYQNFKIVEYFSG